MSNFALAVGWLTVAIQAGFGLLEIAKTRRVFEMVLANYPALADSLHALGRMTTTEEDLCQRA